MMAAVKIPNAFEGASLAINWNQVLLQMAGDKAFENKKVFEVISTPGGIRIAPVREQN